MTVYTLAWLVVLLPLLGWLFSYIAVAPRRSAQIGIAFCGLAALLAAFLLAFRLIHRADGAYESVITFWELRPTEGAVFAPTLTPMLGVRVDALSVVFLATVALISLLVQWHGLVLMKADVELRRFYQVLGVFTFAMLGVVASPNLFQFWLMGEVAAVSAYLLAVHWWTSSHLASGARRMFLYLRIGDLALLFAVVFAYIKVGRHAAALPPSLGAETSDPLSFGVLGGEWRLAHAGAIPGVGTRTLVLLAVLVLLAASVRALQLLFHSWLVEAAGAPPVTLALLASVLAGSGVLLLARVFPLFLEVPHMLTAIAVVGAGAAVVSAGAALAQRDIVRLAIFASAAQLGLVVAGLGMGGYDRSMFALLAHLLLTPLLFMVVSNIVRVFRTQEIGEIHGMWPRMRWSSIGLALWAGGVAGAGLINYQVLAAAFHNRAPNGVHLGAPARAMVVVTLLTAMALTAVCAVRLVLGVCRGEPPRRRGLQPERIVEAEPRLRRAVALMCVVTVVVLVGAAIPRFSLSRFIFYGDRAQPPGWDAGASLAALMVAAAGTVVAWWLSSSMRSTGATAIAAPPRLRAGTAAALDLTPWIARFTSLPLLAASRLLNRSDRGIVDAVGEAVSDGLAALGNGPRRWLSPRVGVQIAIGTLGVVLLAVAAVLAATGHLLVRAS